MINFYGLCNVELSMSYMRKDIEILAEDGIIEYYDYGQVLHLIKIDPYYAYRYARDVMKCRWIEVEPIIIKDIYCAYAYAKYVMCRRWKEAEPIIRGDKWYWRDYCRDFGI